jgi:thioredoxin 1
MGLKEASAFNFKGLTKEGIVLVDFYAPWCGPCRMLSRSLGELAEDFNIVKVDIDSQEALKEKYDVMSVPTMVFLKDGEEVKRETGFMPAEAIREILENL